MSNLTPIMNSNHNLDLAGNSRKAGSSPDLSSPLQQKRKATSPLTEDSRLNKTNPANNGTPQTDEAQTSTSNQQEQVEEQEANDNTPTPPTVNIAIHNQYFPTFKLLRKLNNKLITSQHHKTFLIDLKTKGQVPKGLQAKSAPTGAELDLELYHEWELAHIELANRLRDILIRHWSITEANLCNLITEHTEKLRREAPEEQTNLILQLIEKANKDKSEELASRRSRKQQNARRTGTSAGANPDPTVVAPQ